MRKSNQQQGIRAARQFGHIFVFALLISCNPEDPLEKYAPVLEIFPNSPVTTVTINEADIIDLTSDGYDIISAPKGASQDVGAGRWPSVMGGSIFNSGFNSPIIKEIDLETGELLSERKMEGEGPVNIGKSATMKRVTGITSLQTLLSERLFNMIANGR